MNFYKHYLTENDCYKRGRIITPKGIMVHSTGANNPNLSRYVDDGRLGEPSSRHWNQSGVRACVHAFIGKMADGTVATVQTLPWTMRGWHCAKGKNGSGNDTHIGFEICEDGLKDGEYFNAVYAEAVDLVAMLCRQFDLDPLADGVVICHCEGYDRGISSNHADVEHWFPLHGKSMDTFRADVAKELSPHTDASYEEFLRNMRKYMDEIANAPASPWAAVLLADAKEMGLTDGTRPQAPVTREECAIMARKAALYK